MPHPYHLRPGKAAQKVRCSQCLYVGDSGVDMQTARAAGMFAVGALWGFRGKEELLKNGAQLLINKPGEVLEYLDRKGP